MRLHRWQRNGDLGAWICVKPSLGDVPSLDRCAGCGGVVTDRTFYKFGFETAFPSSGLDLIAATEFK